MNKVEVKIINKSDNPLPCYETTESAGMDVRAWLPEGPMVLKPMQRALVPTGLYLQLPRGFECQVRPRSGLSLNSGITVVNSPGTVDADYRGEVGIIIINLSDNDFTIKSGDRIAQFVIVPVWTAQWEVVKELDRTKRENGAFGHTGIS